MHLTWAPTTTSILVVDDDEPILDSVESVLLVHSTDGAYTFERTEMSATVADPITWDANVPFEGGTVAAFVEVTYCDDVERYYMTSVPYLSDGFVPRIRPVPEF